MPVPSHTRFIAAFAVAVAHASRHGKAAYLVKTASDDWISSTVPYAAEVQLKITADSVEIICEACADANARVETDYQNLMRQMEKATLTGAEEKP